MSKNLKPKLLLADDEQNVCMYMSTLLEAHGFEIIGEAHNGQEAIKLCTELKPDVILLDINMPIMTGIDALKEIKQIQPDAIVIMLSFVTDLDEVRRCQGYGAANYIRKDTPVEEIAELIERTWQEKLES